MNEVYLGHFRRGAENLPVAVTDERLQGMGEIADIGDARPIAAGFGWERYPALLAQNEALIREVVPIRHPRAQYLLPLGAAGQKSGEIIDPKALNPAYLRQKVAEKSAPAS